MPDCAELPTCHQEAVCVMDPALQRHICECRAGYVGDGYSCYRQQERVSDG